MNLRYMLMNEVGLLAAGRIANMNARIHGQTGENMVCSSCAHFNEEMD